MKRLFWLCLMLLSLVSCAPTQTVKKDTPEKTVPEADLPRVIAVMPFKNETEDNLIAGQMRKTFYNQFSSKPYRDIELSLVDEKIVHLEKSTGKNIFELKPEEICQAIGCDGLIYGRVIDYKKVYAAVYSQLGVEAEIWIINTKTGKEAFRLKDSVRYHQGGVPMSPLGAIMTVVSTAINLREIQQIRMVNELCYKFAEKIPSPKGLPVEDRPLIKEVLTNVTEGPFGKSKIIRAGLEGETGVVATFNIGNFKKGIPMKETKPGIYMGEYLVLPGDNTRDMPIVAFLKRPGGYESEWVDVSGFVTIDTTPPTEVKGTRAKGFIDRIELTWDEIRDIPDLKGYIVLRSGQPLSGYTEVARLETNIFADITAVPETTYYYRVIAFDAAGNESDPHYPVRAKITSKEPTVLSGNIEKDTVLSGTYFIKGELKVMRGISLTILPETRIMFDEGASIRVQGTMLSDASSSMIEFIPAENKQWKGIIFDGGHAAMNGFRIQAAETAMQMQNTEGSIENCIISGSPVGILISGTPSPIIKNCSISGNKTGIELQKTDAKIIGSSIIQNADGIVLKGFSGEIKDNIIMDNENNISSETPVKIDANYLGSVNIDEMKLSGVSVTKVFDNRPPQGKIVDAVSNPYAALTLEGRKGKAAELLIEAGSYFRQRNYGKASALFEEALKASPSAEIYYYLALCYQEMKENEKAVKYLSEGVDKFPQDSTLWKSLGMMHYEKGNEAEAEKALKEVLRLSPDDRQARFLLERIGKQQ